VVFHYWLMPRVAYAPTIGLALLVALALDVGARHAPSREGLARAGRLGVGIVAASAAVCCALMLIGAQSMFQKRAARDLAEVAALRTLVPDPEPGSVFVPVRVARPPVRPRAEGFEPWFEGAMNNWWSARWIVRFEYRRADLDCGHTNWWDQQGFERVDPDGVVVRGVPDGPVGWERVIPFEIDERNRVRLIGRVVAENDGARRTFDVPQVLRLDAGAMTRAGFEPPGEFVQGKQ
jgi:hypothetical protein